MLCQSLLCCRGDIWTQPSQTVIRDHSQTSAAVPGYWGSGLWLLHVVRQTAILQLGRRCAKMLEVSCELNLQKQKEAAKQEVSDDHLEQIFKSRYIYLIVPQKEPGCNI